MSVRRNGVIMQKLRVTALCTVLFVCLASLVLADPFWRLTLEPTSSRTLETFPEGTRSFTTTTFADATGVVDLVTSFDPGAVSNYSDSIVVMGAVLNKYFADTNDVVVLLNAIGSTVFSNSAHSAMFLKLMADNLYPDTNDVAILVEIMKSYNITNMANVTNAIIEQSN